MNNEQLLSVLICFLIIAFYVIIIQASMLWDKRKGRHGKFKLGLDIHGVVTVAPAFFSWLTKIIIEAGGEVHILTGRRITPYITNKIKEYDLHYTHLFSITDHLIATGAPILKKEDEDNYWFPEEIWNAVKGWYAKMYGLHILWDDSPEYASYCSVPFVLMLSSCLMKHKEFYQTKKGLVRTNDNNCKKSTTEI